MPVPFRKVAIVFGQSGRGPVLLLRLSCVRRRHHVSAGAGGAGLCRSGRAPRRQGGHRTQLHRPSRVGHPPEAQAPAGQGGGGGRLLPRAAEDLARCLGRSFLPAQQGLRRRGGGPLPHRLGPRQLGRAVPGVASRRRDGHRHRAGLHQQGRTPPGLLPGTGAVSHLRPGGPCGRLRRAHHAGGGGGQVQELPRQRSVPQEPPALRAQLGPPGGGTQRQGGDLRGLHRCDRVSPCGGCRGGGDVRYQPHRGPPEVVVALRRQGGARLRRRRRWPGRSRAHLRLGEGVQPGGRGGATARRIRPRRAQPVRPRSPGRSGAGRRAHAALPSGAGARSRGCRHPRGPGAAGDDGARRGGRTPRPDGARPLPARGGRPFPPRPVVAPHSAGGAQDSGGVG